MGSRETGQEPLVGGLKLHEERTILVVDRSPRILCAADADADADATAAAIPAADAAHDLALAALRGPFYDSLQREGMRALSAPKHVKSINILNSPCTNRAPSKKDTRAGGESWAGERRVSV